MFEYMFCEVCFPEAFQDIKMHLVDANVGREGGGDDACGRGKRGWHPAPRWGLGMKGFCRGFQGYRGEETWHGLGRHEEHTASQDSF